MDAWTLQEYLGLIISIIITCADIFTGETVIAFMQFLDQESCMSHYL
jgi:hypothetical protein